MNTGRLNQLSSEAHSSAEHTFRAMRAVVLAELSLSLRKSSLPILLALLAGISLLLTPPENAGYAIFTVDGMRAAMPAGTRLIVAGIVINLLLFPGVTMALGMGYERDRQLRVAPILFTCPLDRSLIACARIVANAVFVIVLSVLVLALLAMSVFIREKQLPGLASICAFPLVTVPAALFGIIIGVALDRWLGRSLLGKTAVSFVVYALATLLAVIGRFDIFGVRLLTDSLPTGTNAPSFAIGFVPSPGGSAIPLAMSATTLSFLCHQGELVVLAILVGALVAWSSRFSPNEKEVFQRNQDQMSEPKTASQSNLSRIAPQGTKYHQVAWILLRRWLTRSLWIPLTAASALVLSLANPHSLRAGPAVALLLPLLVANRGHLSAAGARDLEHCTVALWRPTPTLLAATMLAAMVVLFIFPVLFAAPLVASLHLLAGVLTLSLWLAWTCSELLRPLLGISIYALVWYVECLSEPPPALDLLSADAASSLAFAIALSVSAVLIVACLHRDAYVNFLRPFGTKRKIPWSRSDGYDLP